MKIATSVSKYSFLVIFVCSLMLISYRQRDDQQAIINQQLYIKTL